MEDKQNLTNWKIPYGVGYSKLIKLMRLILQKNGDKQLLSIDSIISSSIMPSNFVPSNLAFLKSIKIIEMTDTKSCRLTDTGTKFIRALSLDNKKDVEEYGKSLIKNSYLKDIQDLIETEGKELTVEKLYRLIKTNANISDGDRSGNMPTSSSTGVNALLQFLEKCKVLPLGILQPPKSSILKNTPKTTKKFTKKHQTIPTNTNTQPITNSDEFYTLKSDTFNISIRKSLNLDDFETIEDHMVLFLKSIKNKINSNST